MKMNVYKDDTDGSYKTVVDYNSGYSVVRAYMNDGHMYFKSVVESIHIHKFI